jgi:formylglycine-generating enzyme required for sulfatase activity
MSARELSGHRIRSAILVHYCFVQMLLGAARVACGQQVDAGDTTRLVGQIETIESPRMIRVPACTFMMGDGVAGCGKDEHSVTLRRAFFLAQHEVTNQEYFDMLIWARDRGYVVIGSDAVWDTLRGVRVKILDLASRFCEIRLDEAGDLCLRASESDFARKAFPGGYDPASHPVKEVTWHGAAAFCDWLNLKEGLPLSYESSEWKCNAGDPYGARGYRLPTDAEWECAARFADGRPYPWGSTPPDCRRANSWPDPPCLGWTSPSGSFPDAPETLGFSDLAGNVWEWCNDWLQCDLGSLPHTDPPGPESGTIRVLRGGSWRHAPGFLRSAYRFGMHPVSSGSYVGFRLARSDPGASMKTGE